jgi:hypothetical protein
MRKRLKATLINLFSWQMATAFGAYLCEKILPVCFQLSSLGTLDDRKGVTTGRE